MMTTGDSIPFAEISEIIGLVDGIAEAGMGSVSVGGITLAQGGGLAELVAAARAALAQSAGNVGAEAVIGLRITITGRALEKSVVAYGTAVRLRK